MRNILILNAKSRELTQGEKLKIKGKQELIRPLGRTAYLKAEFLSEGPEPTALASPRNRGRFKATQSKSTKSEI